MSEKKVQQNKWDLLVRLSHWSTVLLFGFCWYSAENGMMQWHYYSGYVLLSVICVRTLWGFVGRADAKFVNFIKSPARVLSYLKNIKSSKPADGHSPAGGYSVLALLLLLFSQTVSGLFAVETDGFDGGPLSESIDYDLSLSISEFHQLNFDILLAFVALHIIAVMFYQKVLKQKLLQKMSLFK